MSDKHMEAARDIEFDFDCDWTADGRRRGEAERNAAIEAIATALSASEAKGRQDGVREGMKRADWQPIETLVRDGREVLMFSPEQGQAVWPATERTWPHVTHWAPLPPDPIDEANQ